MEDIKRVLTDNGIDVVLRDYIDDAGHYYGFGDFGVEHQAFDHEGFKDFARG